MSSDTSEDELLKAIKFGDEIPLLAYAMESMSHFDRCAALMRLADEQHGIGFKNGRFGYLPKSKVVEALGKDEIEYVTPLDTRKTHYMKKGRNQLRQQIRNNLGLDDPNLLEAKE